MSAGITGLQRETAGKTPYVPVKSRFWNAVVDGGIKGDAVELADVVVTSGSNVVNCASASFTAADIGKKIAIQGCGNAGGTADITSGSSGGNLITAVNSPTQLVMTTNALRDSVAARTVTDAAISQGAQTLTSATATFSPNDVGKTVTITLAGETNRQIVSYYGAITSGAAVLTASYACFPTSIVGKRVQVSGAGVSGAPLFATVLSRASATSITLDTNASTTVAASASTGGALVQAWTIVTLSTRITQYTNATTVVVQRMASQTVTGATAAISGHVGVYGTDDRVQWGTFLGLVNAGDTIYLPRGCLSLLGQGAFVINKAVKFVAADPYTAGFHVALTNGRITPQSDNITFDDVLFKAIAGVAGTTDVWSAVSSAGTGPYKNWKFNRVRFDHTRSYFGRVGAQQGDGTTNTSTSNFEGKITLNDCEWSNNIGDGCRFDGVDDVSVNNPWIHDVGSNFGAVNSFGIKFQGAASGVIRAGLVEWCYLDGIDLFDGQHVKVIGTTIRHCGNLGLTSKWQTTQHYTATAFHEFIGVTAWNCGGTGIQANTSYTRVVGCHAIGCGVGPAQGNGFRTATAADTNLAADPTLATSYSGCVAIGNQGIGFAISGRYETLSDCTADNNGADGFQFNGADCTASNINARNNTSNDINAAAAAARTSINQYRTTTGAVTINAAAVGTLLNFYGEEAAGISGTPTAASWPIGATVQNTSDSTYWIKGTTGGFVKIK